MGLGFGPNLSAFGPKWTQVFSRNWADGRQARSEKISCLHIGTDSIVARLQDRSLVQSMKITPSLVAVIVVVALVLVVVLKFWGQGGILPPHEFAYGTAMRNSDAIAERMDQFLSLEALDPKQVQIQTFVGNNSAKNLTPLISYISSQRGHDFGALVAALKEVDQLPDQKEKAIRLVKTLPLTRKL
jgi:hypothetical protein